MLTDEIVEADGEAADVHSALGGTGWPGLDKVAVVAIATLEPFLRNLGKRKRDWRQPLEPNL